MRARDLRILTIGLLTYTSDARSDTSTYNMLISRKKITVVNETVRKLFNAELKCKKLILILNISHKGEAK